MFQQVGTQNIIEDDIAVRGFAVLALFCLGFSEF